MQGCNGGLDLRRFTTVYEGFVVDNYRLEALLCSRRSSLFGQICHGKKRCLGCKMPRSRCKRSFLIGRQAKHSRPGAVVGLCRCLGYSGIVGGQEVGRLVLVLHHADIRSRYGYEAMRGFKAGFFFFFFFTAISGIRLLASRHLSMGMTAILMEWKGLDQLEVLYKTFAATALSFCYVRLNRPREGSFSRNKRWSF